MSVYAARVVYAVIFFVLASALVLIVKPRHMFDQETGKPKPFGTGPGKTLFSLGTVIGVIAVSSFYVFSLVDMTYACADAAKKRGAEMSMLRLSPDLLSARRGPVSDAMRGAPPPVAAPTSSPYYGYDMDARLPLASSSSLYSSSYPMARPNYGY